MAARHGLKSERIRTITLERISDALQAGQLNSSFAPHSSQKEASAGLSLWHLEQSIGQTPSSSSSALRLLIARVEAFGEPAVDLGEHHACFVAATLPAKQLCQPRVAPWSLGSDVEALGEHVVSSRSVG